MLVTDHTFINSTCIDRVSRSLESEVVIGGGSPLQLEEEEGGLRGSRATPGLRHRCACGHLRPPPPPPPPGYLWARRDRLTEGKGGGGEDRRRPTMAPTPQGHGAASREVQRATARHRRRVERGWREVGTVWHRRGRASSSVSRCQCRPDPRRIHGP